MIVTDAVKNYFCGSGIKLKTVSFKGEVDAMGVFTDSLGLLGIKKGIILSTGRAEAIQGKNSRPNSGANFGGHFFSDEHFITRSDMCDGVVLEFDFIPEFDSISFCFVFGSEEYPEFVGKEFNDAFALLVWGKQPYTKPKNIGILPNGSNIMINNINHLRNAEWYIANDQLTNTLFDFVEYDGFTKPMHVGCKVIPGKLHHLKILIADLEDCEYDSGILLEAASFKSISTQKAVPLKRTYTFKFEVDEANLQKKEIGHIKRFTDSLALFQFDSIIIIGHTDSTGDEAYNDILSLKRAETIATFFAAANVKAKQIRCEGKGSSMPIKSNDTREGRSANRRVEIWYYRKMKR